MWCIFNDSWFLKHINFQPGTEEVLSKVEAFNTRYNQYKEWQEQAEQSLQQCLPIEADLDRLEEQQEILQVRTEQMYMYNDGCIWQLTLHVHPSACCNCNLFIQVVFHMYMYCSISL